jgi:predicted N-acyltransferase
MSYSHRLFNSIDEVDVNDWQRVSCACGEPIFSDRRFIAAVEAGMRRSYRFWHVIVYDERGNPIACASLSATTIDIANVAHPGLSSMLRRLPEALRRLRTFKVLFCGLPVSAGQHSLALTSRSDSLQILSTLDGTISDLAAELRMDVVVYKDFARTDLQWMSPLLGLGYRRVATLPMHSFTPLFQDFQQYCAALRSHYRYKINRSIQKLRNAGIEISIRADSKEIIAVYTPQVHSLYHQVVEKADAKIETLSIEFFHELAARLEGQVDLVLLSKGSRIIAFGWCLRNNSTYHMLFAGIDYELNAELDLYFNLMYAWLDCGLRKHVSKIEAGQTAGTFKARLGCYPEPLYTFMKGLGPLMSLAVRLGADLILAQEPAVGERHVFRRGCRRGLASSARVSRTD